MRQRKVRNFCNQNFKKFLQESTLHGLRFIGDDSITIWERLFFLCAFVAALVTTGNLITYIYSKWNLTPVIIATNPFPTVISDIPFPAITLCNMNQLALSKVANYSKNSYESALMEMACFYENDVDDDDIPLHYKNNNMTITDFLFKHSQSCSDMLLSCHFNSFHYECEDLFQEYLTDEGLCCIFNIVDKTFRYRDPFKPDTSYTTTDGAIPVDWSPEFGFQKNRPKKFYPRTSDGIGVSMGLTLILDAQVNDYYCSSTNGPGFKIDLHSPIDAPRVKDIGLTISPGQDTRFRLSVRSSSATPSTRGFSSSVRRCLFNAESKLVYYKYYTRKNCEKECLAHFIYRLCKCIPYNLPLVFMNASECGAPESFCINRANRYWLRYSDDTCRQNCLGNCFSLKYSANSFAAPLTQGDYRIQNARKLQNISRQYIKDNIALVNIFFHEFIFHGDVRNVYVGFNEFLANIGGILGLFLGFSFISLIEVFYYAVIRPIVCWMRPDANQEFLEENINTAIWYSHELYPAKQKNMRNGWLAYQRHQFKEENRWKNIESKKMHARMLKN